MSKSHAKLLWVMVLSLLSAATIGSASAAGSCPFDGDFSAIRTVPFPKLYGWVESIPQEKGEFEKSTAFEERRNNALQRVSATLKTTTGFDGIIVKKRILGAHYDADRESVSIKTADRYVSPIYDFVFLDDSTGLEADSLDMGRYTTDLGQYDAQNAFGAHALVTKQLVFEDFVSFGKGGHRNTPRFASPTTFRLPTEKAKEAMSALEIAVAGKLMPPFINRQENHSEAKIDYPYDVRTITKIIFIRPVCGVIRNAETGEIYAHASIR